MRRSTNHADPISEPFLAGRIIKRVITAQGGDFFVILADGTAKGKRFRADARLFACPDKICPDTIISFYPDDEAKQTPKSLLRVRQIVFEPQTELKRATHT